MAAATSAPPLVIFAIVLGDDGSPDDSRKYIRLPPPPSLPAPSTDGDADKAAFTSVNNYRLRFILPAGSIALRHGRIMTNYPLDVGDKSSTQFQRTVFHSLPYIIHKLSEYLNYDISLLFHPFRFQNDQLTDGWCEMEITQAGAFEYYVEYSLETSIDGNSQATSWQTSQRRGYFIVDPRLDIVALPRSVLSPSVLNVSHSHVLNMDSICLLSVVPKWLGPMTNWPAYFRISSHSGYNMIHFVPLQKRGASNSPYSIYDQLSLSDDLFPPGAKLSEQKKYNLLEEELKRLHEHEGMLSVTDIVWNHTAHNSAWLEEHPEAGYNLVNSPHLQPAYELDEAILRFSRQIQQHGLSPFVQNEQDLDILLHAFHERELKPLKLWEFYVLDVSSLELEFRAVLEKTSLAALVSFQDLSFKDLARLSPAERVQRFKKNVLVDRYPGKRFGKQTRTDVAISFVASMLQLCDPLTPESISRASQEYRRLLDDTNVEFYHEYDADTARILENMRNRCKFERLADHGPKSGAISEDQPLVATYFTRIRRTSKNQHMPSGALVVANNGWIWNADPLVDFAGPSSKSYLIREVIPWGDCVKLRYGSGREENPWLWDHIAEYTKLMATYFHGFRIDNCHSTPLHVAQYFLDLARTIRTDLYVVAELFTGSEERDITFVSKLGINSLIREAMNAWDAPELSRLIHRYGGQPVGSMALKGDYLPLELVGHHPADVTTPISEHFDQCPAPWIEPEIPSRPSTPSTPNSTAKNTSYKHKATPNKKPMDRHYHSEPHPQAYPEHAEQVVFRLRGSVPHALFMDCTHDNETPFQRRVGADTLSTGALVCMANCAVGSVRGYDELVPKHLNVVNETRRYSLDDTAKGISEVKAVMQRLHYLLGQKGYTEIHVHQEKEFVAVFRQNPFTHHGYLLIANTAFRQHEDVDVRPFVLRNSSYKTTIAARIRVDMAKYKRDDTVINGVPCDLEVSYGEPLPGMMDVQSGSDHIGYYYNIVPRQFPCGSILLLETDLLPDSCKAIESFKLNMNLSVHGSWYLDGIVREDVPELQEAIGSLGLVEMNVVLYRCHEEEMDSAGGHGVYTIPDFGPLPYAGLQGFATLLRSIARNNDLGHALCNHLRQGFWALDYTVARLDRYLQQYPKLERLRDWFRARFALIKRLPNFLIPKCFNMVIMTAYDACIERCILLMSPWLHRSGRFTRLLAMGSVQLYGDVKSTGLTPAFHSPSLAAGLPHFATNHMRCWGRDIFISLRGMFLVTGRFAEAREHLVAFAGCLRHGLIPNLLDASRRPRYNARDATWFFLLALQEYCGMSPEGLEILNTRVLRRFPNDAFIPETDPQAYERTCTMREIVQEIMECHACGIHFEEWNAGPGLDHAMRKEGFQIDISMDPQTGFLLGGNRWNCGTWMDKMGDSEKAGTRGVPATPRDGAAVEIIGLLKSALRWLKGLAETSQFPKGVVLKDGRTCSYSEWDRLVQENFERNFYVPEDAAEDGNYEVATQSVHRRGIYKDSVRSTLGYTDYQLRPNFPIAMVVAPELFHAKHAKKALDVAKNMLLGPLGMKTLDPADWAYRGDYDNANDSADPTVAHGFNYHQGPEWLWVTGFFLQAYYHFHKSTPDVNQRLVHEIQRTLRQHKTELLETNRYAGLPELTNANGKECHHGCDTQAWSFATLLDLLHRLKQDVHGKVE